jgi:hypothetical protein
VHSRICGPQHERRVVYEAGGLGASKLAGGLACFSHGPGLWPLSSRRQLRRNEACAPARLAVLGKVSARMRTSLGVPDRCSPGRVTVGTRLHRGLTFHVSARARLPRAVPLHHQRAALAKHCVFAKGEGRDARAIFGSALTEKVERLAIARGPVQRGDSIVHLSRHHPTIQPRVRIQPLHHEEDFARTGQVYNGWSDDYPAGYPFTRKRGRLYPSPGLSAKVSGFWFLRLAAIFGQRAFSPGKRSNAHLVRKS